ncbi:MAG TPA: AtpZ/AtpI family protein [Methylomirabilota bacterium]|jgi:ATP synthase protein I
MASGERPPWTEMANIAQVGLTLVVATVIGLGAGYYLDRWLGTKPWLTLVGLGFGIAAGFLNLFRAVKKLQDDGNNGE